MVELVDTMDSKSNASGRAGSIPALSTKALVNHLIFKGYFDLHTQATGLFLDAQKKGYIINFLKTLTNDVYLNNEEYKNSFE